MDGLKARLSFDAVAYDYDDEYLTIDTDTHTININNVSRLFGVQYDGNSKLIKFKIRNKLSDIQKMQDSIVYINWIDSKGVKGQSIAVNKTINNDTCEFAWKVPFDALKNSGVLHFAMSAVVTKNSSSVIDQRWSTQIASVITPDGIYIKSYTPSSEEEDRIAQIYNELSNMINKQNENLQSQVNSLKEDISQLSEEIADKATLENGVVKFWKTSTEENRTDTLLYSVDISSIGGTGGLDLENLTLSVSQVGNYQRLSMSDGTTTKNVDIPITTITDEQVSTAVQKYLEENPVSALDASTAETNQVPVADGNGNWSWKTQQFGTGLEEADPTVPNWAKQPNKPTYTADEVGALPDTTKIPSKTSDLQNDSGFLTRNEIPEKLPNPYPLTFTGGASGSYDGSKALTINIPSGGDGSTYYVTPEQFGAIGDGVTDDTEAFRQAIETGYPIICMTGKDYYFANEIVTSKTRINIDGNYSHFTAFRLKINLNEDETNWKKSYPHPDSVIQNVYFMNKNNMDYCIKTGIPIKFVNINIYSYDLWLKNYGDYMDYMVFDNLAINSKPSNEHYCIELSYLGDNHVFRECHFVGHNTNINCVQVSGCKAVNFIDCIINGNVIAYESVVNLNGCHFENNGQIICGDKNVNSVINFNGCFFYDQYSVTPGKNVFYNGCGFLVNYRAYGGQNDYMSLNTRDCIILCGAESANSNSNVIIDELRKTEYPNVVYSGNKVVLSPAVLKNTAKTWGLSTGTYTYKFFQSCNPYSIDYSNPDYSTVNESVIVDADTSAVRFSIDYNKYSGMFIHVYRTSPDGTIKNVVIPINGQYIYDYGETLNGILWKNVRSIPNPKSTTAVYKNGIYYSGKNYTNAINCICVDKANGVIVWIGENGSPTTKADYSEVN